MKVFGVPVDQLARDYVLEPHVGLLHGWSLVPTAAVVGWFTRRVPSTVLVTPDPAPRAPARRLTGFDEPAARPVTCRLVLWSPLTEPDSRLSRRHGTNHDR